MPWWEWTGRASLTLYLGAPGLAALAARLAGGGPRLAPLFLGMNLLMLLAAALAARGRCLLALLFVAPGPALKAVTHGMQALGLDNALTAVRARPWDLQDVVAVLAIGWIAARALARRGGSVAAARVLALPLAAAVVAYAPAFADRMGEIVGYAPRGLPAPEIKGAGQALPPLLLRAPDGSPFEPAEPGVLYAVNFWASWCAPCLRELPQMQALAVDLEGRLPFRLVAANAEEIEADALAAFLDGRGLGELPFYTGGGRAGEAVGITILPVTLLVRDRRILERYDGTRPDLVEEIRARVLQLAGETGAEGEGG